MREVGIKLEIIKVEWAQWLKQVFTDKDYDLTIVTHIEPIDIDIYSRKPTTTSTTTTRTSTR